MAYHKYMYSYLHFRVLTFNKRISTCFFHYGEDAVELLIY